MPDTKISALDEKTTIDGSEEFAINDAGTTRKLGRDNLFKRGTITSGSLVIDSTVTWNNAGVTFTAWQLNVTNTASAAGSLLLDLQVGGNYKLRSELGASAHTLYLVHPTNDGRRAKVGFDNASAVFGSNTNHVAVFQTNNVTRGLVGTNGYWGLGAAFVNDPVHVLSLGNTTGMALYNTAYTGGTPTNYERLVVKWNTNVAEIVMEKGGTGTARGLKICTAAADLLGFYDATAVAQPSGTGETTGFTAGSGTAVNDDSTFTGNVGATAYRISDIVAHLKTLGLIKQ